MKNLFNERRKNERVSVKLSIFINSIEYQTKDISLFGATVVGNYKCISKSNITGRNILRVSVIMKYRCTDKIKTITSTGRFMGTRPSGFGVKFLKKVFLL